MFWSMNTYHKAKFEGNINPFSYIFGGKRIGNNNCYPRTKIVLHNVIHCLKFQTIE